MNEFFEEFREKRILLVGGAGFVGSNLVQLFLNHVDNIHITIVDNLLSSEIINVPLDKRVFFLENSITDFRILSSIEDKYDYIFHLATYHGNQSSIFDPLKDHENNTLTTLKLFERVKNFKNLKKLVYSSAGCSVAKKTFGEAIATTEDTSIELKQDSPYSISKIIGEFYSVYYYKENQLPVVRARFQNVYGPGEILGAGNWRGTYATIWRNVTPTFIYKAIKGEEIPLENEGNSSRDFIYVEDICKGLILCALKGEAGDVYNIGSGVETTIKELAEKINILSGNKSSIKLLPKRSWDNSGKRFASVVKSRECLGFEANISLEEGLGRTIAWTKENLGYIEKCVERHLSHIKYYDKVERNYKEREEKLITHSSNLSI